MKNIIVTGGAGYIGSHIVLSALERGYETTIFDDLSTIYNFNCEKLYMEVDGNKLYPFGKDGGKDLSKKLDVPILGEMPLLEDITVASEGSDLFAFKNNPNFRNVIDIANEILKFQPKKKPIDLKIN